LYIFIFEFLIYILDFSLGNFLNRTAGEIKGRLIARPLTKVILKKSSMTDSQDLYFVQKINQTFIFILKTTNCLYIKIYNK
jgi:hypothetical protein